MEGTLTVETLEDDGGTTLTVETLEDDRGTTLTVEILEDNGGTTLTAHILEEDCSCLAAHFLAAAFVCQPHKQGWDDPCSKIDPFLHFFIELIWANICLFDGFSVKTGFPSARFISCSAYWHIPLK